ncbi:tripartite tricarboxylate transporter TctB family protein [Actinoplanes utahensis]|uniref:tripartite tricarboxylate transporter TctB family protein n=1 Tax=Actinoplanes utahensis TaxID=1869 RepID=UPI00068BBC6E|nr:tripartite tricarboxylate transporter TctB family protein [Actinoplanes utahensis]GIF33917.1 hypothetical protein Aut01nite_69030 [Actinoplanes utahensis]
MTSATPPDPAPIAAAETDAGAATPEVATASSGPRVAGTVLLLIGVALLWQAVDAGIDTGVPLGGPTLAPILVTGLWVVVAVAYLIDALRKRAADDGPADLRSWIRPVLLLAALIGYAVVLKYTVLGYVLATTVFVLAGARLLETRPVREVIVRDLVTAIGLALGIYLLFTRLLGIVLPAGVLPL